VLTLTRKAGESIRIGDEISIIIKEIKGRQVRIVIVAPRNIYVCREELYLKIQEENVAAHESLMSMGASGESGVADPFVAIGSLFRKKMGYQQDASEDVCPSDVGLEFNTTALSTSVTDRSKVKVAPASTEGPSATLEEVEDEG